MNKVVKNNLRSLRNYIKSTESNCPELLNLFFPITSLAADYLEVFDNVFDTSIELEFKYKEMELSNTLKLVKDFFEELGEDYLNKFNEAVLDGTFDIFHINDLDKKAGRLKEPCCNETDNKIGINMPVNYTIEDGASIVHEFLHFTNSNKGNGTRVICTELISCYMELRYYQFLARKGYDISNYYKGLYMRLNNIFTASDNIAFYGSILDIYKNTGEISNNSIMEMDKQRGIYASNVNNLIQFFSNEGFANEINTFHYDVSYLIGGILAINLAKNFDEYDVIIKSINKDLHKLSIDDVFKLIGFDINKPKALIDYCVEKEKEIKDVVNEDISRIGANGRRKN